MQNSKIFIKLTTLLILLLFIVCVTGFKHEFAPSKNAYATIFYEGTPKDEEYVIGCRVMIRSVKNTGTDNDIVILVAPNVRQSTREKFIGEGAIVREVENIHNPYKILNQKKNGGEIGLVEQTFKPRFEFTLNKLHMWNLTEYERVIYMDSDTIAISSLEELFECGHFCMVYMNPCNFHTGLLVIKPDLNEFNKMLLALNDMASYDGADQGFLTNYFNYEMTSSAPLFNPFAPQKDEKIVRLSPGYNLNALWYYEHSDWRLYSCHSRFTSLPGIPGISLTFPVSPILKPWNFYPFLYLDENWYLWNDIRSELDENFVEYISAVIFGIAVFLFLSIYISYHNLNCCEFKIDQFTPRTSKIYFYFKSLVNSIGKNNFGLIVGVSLWAVAFLIPYNFLIEYLPPLEGWFLFIFVNFGFNFGFILLVSTLFVNTQKKPNLSKLLLSIAKQFTPCFALVFAILFINYFQLYPKWHIHLGKIVMNSQLVFSICCLEINMYRRAVVAWYFDQPKTLDNSN